MSEGALIISAVAFIGCLLIGAIFWDLTALFRKEAESLLVVEQLIHDLQHRGTDFVCGEHTLEDKKTGYSYWVSNSAASSGVYAPYKLNFGASNGRKFHRALEKWKAATNIAKCRAVTA